MFSAVLSITTLHSSTAGVATGLVEFLSSVYFESTYLMFVKVVNYFLFLQDRKRFRPPRPISKKGKKKVPTNHLSQGIVPLEFNADSLEILWGTLGTDYLWSFHFAGSTEDSVEISIKLAVCPGCMNAPADGVFIHGEVAHQVFCYSCAHRIWQERKSCPCCNRTISKVVRLFRADFWSLFLPTHSISLCSFKLSAFEKLSKCKTFCTIWKIC